MNTQARVCQCGVQLHPDLECCYECSWEAIKMAATDVIPAAELTPIEFTATLEAEQIRPGDPTPNVSTFTSLKVSTFFDEGAFVPHKLGGESTEEYVMRQAAEVMAANTRNLLGAPDVPTTTPLISFFGAEPVPATDERFRAMTEDCVANITVGFHSFFPYPSLVSAEGRPAVTPALHEAIRAMLASTCDVLVACEYLSAASYVRIALENVIPRPSINRRVNEAELLAALLGLVDTLKEVERNS